MKGNIITAIPIRQFIRRMNVLAATDWINNRLDNNKCNPTGFIQSNAPRLRLSRMNERSENIDQA